MSKTKDTEEQFVPSKIKRLPPKEPEKILELDMVALLRIGDLSKQDQELGLREYRIRGIDMYIKEIRKVLDKEEKDSLNTYLRMCPPIDRLTDHLLTQYPKSKKWFETYSEKLREKIGNVS